MARNVIMKVCLLGDGAVGKTSLIRKFVYDEFHDKYITTIGTKITKKQLEIDAESGQVNLTLMISDIVGQVEFERIHKQYYRGSKAGIFVCDLTRPETLASMGWWMESFGQVVGKVPMVLMANKCDLEAERRIADRELAEQSARFGCSHYITSAKTGQNVEKAFLDLGRALCRARP